MQATVGGERRRCGREPARRRPHSRRLKPGADLALLGVRCACRTTVAQLAEHPIERGGLPTWLGCRRDRRAKESDGESGELKSHWSLRLLGRGKVAGGCWS